MTGRTRGGKLGVVTSLADMWFAVSYIREWVNWVLRRLYVLFGTTNLQIDSRLKKNRWNRAYKATWSSRM
jgi:hypothetical protein